MFSAIFFYFSNFQGLLRSAEQLQIRGLCSTNETTPFEENQFFSTKTTAPIKRGRTKRSRSKSIAETTTNSKILNNNNNYSERTNDCSSSSSSKYDNIPASSSYNIEPISDRTNESLKSTTELKSSMVVLEQGSLSSGDNSNKDRNMTSLGMGMVRFI